MNFLSQINHIPLKYVVGMNLAVLVLAITFTSINTVSRTTENRSQAAATPLPSPITQITVDPSRPPKLLASDPDWAKIGDALLIKGENLGTFPFGQIYLGEIPITSQEIIEWTPDHLVITIPNLSTSNPLTLRYNQDQILQTSNIIRIVDTNQSGL